MGFGSFLNEREKEQRKNPSAAEEEQDFSPSTLPPIPQPGRTD
jgi:hypothetical protein